MALKITHKGKESAKSGDILDLIPSLKLHPGEDPEHFAALEDAMIAEFAPATAMEMSLVKRIAGNEWEHHRSDELRANIARACLRKMVLEVLLNGTMRDVPELAERNLADALVSDDADLRQKARGLLAKAGISAAEIHAQAYLQSFREFETLERRPDVFDRRRRDLVEDLLALQRRRQEATVEDAELVGSDGD